MVGRSARAKDDGPTVGGLARATLVVEVGGCSDRGRPAVRFVPGHLPTPSPPGTFRCARDRLRFCRSGGWCEVAPSATPWEAVGSAAATVTGRARLSPRLKAEGSSPAEGDAAEVTTDMSWWPGGARVNAVVCGRGRRTGLQNILDFGTAPHTSCLGAEGAEGYRIQWRSWGGGMQADAA